MTYRALCASLLLVLGLVRPAQSNLITYLSDDRSIRAYAAACDEWGSCESDEDSAAPEPPFSVFDRTVFAKAYGVSVSDAEASQTSVLGSSSMTGDGSVFADDMNLHASAFSTFEVRFSLDTALPFSLAGSLSVLSASASVALETGDGTLLYGDDLVDYDSLPLSLDFDYSGILDAGTYNLRLGATAPYSESGGGSWNFQFVVVPEPGTGVLVLVGLLSLCGCKQRRRRHATCS